MFDYVSYLLLVGTDIIFDEEDVVYVAEDGYGCAYCFYDVLADYFVCIPQSGDLIIDLIVQLWSQSFASNIFCLLFYKRVCIYFLLGLSLLYYLNVLGCMSIRVSVSSPIIRQLGFSSESGPWGEVLYLSEVHL